MPPRRWAVPDASRQTAVPLDDTRPHDARTADEAGAAARRRFEALFQFAPDALLLATPEGSIIRANRQAERLFGYTTDEFVGTAVGALLPSSQFDERHEHRPAPSPRPQSQTPPGVPSQQARRKDGSEFLADVTLGTLDDVDDPTVIIAVRDVTVRDRLEEQLRQIQRLEVVGQLSGGIAHDFNNLVQVMGTSADLALGLLPPGAPLRRDIEVIREAALRASALTRQLLTFSGRQAAQPEILDLEALSRRLAPILQRLMGPSITVAIASPGPVWPVLADPTHIEQVLLNLLANARDAMPGGGTLSIELSNVTVEPDGGGPGGALVQMVVRDSGVGMDPDTRARVFEPFFTTKARGKGSGLGLSTVYGIVTQCGGDIHCGSEPGQGTAFTIRLPGVTTETTPRPAAADTLDEADARGSETILVIDDEEFLRMSIGRILERKGYRVLSAGSGEEALRLLEAHEGPLHLVLSDVLMPGLCGWDVAARLRERWAVPVLFTSGCAEDAEFEERLHQLEAHFIAKPFTGVSLLRTVRDLLEASDDARG
ncbi:MAG: response regulator [Acidobacteria bacterium]|nr:response regulator [Acidobacteriota bacterium]